ncbi:MAG: hypothetical protein ABIJ56_02005 [Pseudomonadota bacterium]
MMKDNGTIQRAVSDLAMIRKAIERARGDVKPEKAYWPAMRAKMMVQSISLVFALAILLAELGGGHALTHAMMVLSPIWDQAILGVATVGVILALLALSFYFIVWRSARHSDQDMARFIADNFQYLRSLSLLADLLVKFIVFSLLILAPRPEWIAPLLMVFTADYMLQGRYFNLPIKASLALGVLCIAGAAAMYLTGTTLLVWPLALFAAVNALSLAVLLRAWRSRTSDKGEQAS